MCFHARERVIRIAGSVEQMRSCYWVKRYTGYLLERFDSADNEITRICVVVEPKKIAIGEHCPILGQKRESGGRQEICL
jgi:hypothetical protein